jgi:hypothetical protein
MKISKNGANKVRKAESRKRSAPDRYDGQCIINKVGTRYKYNLDFEFGKENGVMK